MLEQLQEIILDNQKSPLVTGLPRELQITVLPGKATVCMGVRRAGKSTFMLQRMQQLLKQGVARENIVQINFVDNRLYNFHHTNLELVLEAYYSIYPDKKSVEKVYFFFDEIQEIEHWEYFVERLMRLENCEVYITGSSAKLLSKEIATQMRGRSLAWEIFPFSFAEFLNYREIKYVRNMNSQQRLFVQKGFNEYLAIGAFPEVTNVDRNIRIKLHQEYFNTILFRDLIERHNIKNPQSIIEVANLLINNVANSYTINSITGYLKSLNHKISKEYIGQYIDWFEDAYFLFSVKIYDASISRTNTNPKKIYCIDHALVTSVSSGVLVNSGHLLENLIFITLRRHSEKIYYYKTRNGREVDFIFVSNHGKKVLIQVCESLVEPKTKKREFEALNEAMAELEHKVGIIVTLKEEDEMQVTAGLIKTISAWKFLLFTAEYLDLPQ